LKWLADCAGIGSGFGDGYIKGSCHSPDLPPQIHLALVRAIASSFCGQVIASVGMT
jgi:hypothetical protein